MDKTAIKNFAVEARNMLRDSAISQAGLYGITEDECTEPVQTGNGFEVYKTIAGTDNRIFGDTIKKRASLVKAIDEKGFDNVIEEVAYTWFNRLIAIRFMEVNDYLPTRVRVLSSETSGKKEPDIVTQSLDIELNMSQEELAEVQKAKDENRYDDAFGLLFIKQCNELNDILPGLFEKTDDYMELLLKLSYIKDDVIRTLVDTVPEEDFDVSKEGQVEIIGWLYQYYNIELKDETFALLKKNVKITKERIPAATQLFTPDWIVRYMVENSLGRLWIEHLRANDPFLNEKQLAEEFGWKYYLPEAKQQDSVNIKLAEIRTSYKDMTLMDIKCIDPCMGSGHILVYMFDVLMDIYKSEGYSERDAVFYILENNINGLDIDQRAYQLSYFALMMKGREYNRRFFAGREVEQGGRSWRKNLSPNIRSIKESNTLPDDLVNQIKENFIGVFNDNELKCIQYVMDLFKDAKEYGSILNVDNEARQYASVALKLYSLIDETHPYCIENNLDIVQRLLIAEHFPIIDELMMQACVMSENYDVVITNPPYMGGSGMSKKLYEYAKKYYYNSKSDLFSIFIEKCNAMCNLNGIQAMITQQAWMFLKSFLKLREIVLKNQIVDMVHLGARAFDEISGEVVQTTSFVIRKSNIPNYCAYYSRLTRLNGEKEKRNGFLRRNKLFLMNQDKIKTIPEKPLAYWLSSQLLKCFQGKKLNDVAKTKQGFATGNNNLYLRFWFEINNRKMNKKWFPCNKGGAYRKWYGNNTVVADWENNGFKMKAESGSVIRNPDYYFKEGLTWSSLGNEFGVRYSKEGYLFESKGSMCFVNEKSDLRYILGLLNSCVARKFLSVLAPTLDFHEGPVGRIPIAYSSKEKEVIEDLVERNIQLSQNDWDDFEISWDFKNHPLVRVTDNNFKTTIESKYKDWKNYKDMSFSELKINEELINQKVINIYSLKDEMNSTVFDDSIKIRKADLERDIKSFISYAVGCMTGRYSLDVEGLAYAGGEWDDSKYKTFIPDADNIIPITDEEYFDDDIVCRFVDFVKVVYGEDTLEENLDFIASVLAVKGKSSREIIRNYFIKDFYKDHCKIYKKRPIYWLFDSGKQNGFKALIYMHLYDKDTVGRIRTNYLHKTQNAIEGALKNAEYIISSSTSAVDKANATKDRDKYIKQLNEMKIYDQALAHVALKRIDIDLDDGVKHNYELFQEVEISSEGEDAKKKKVNLLAKI